MHPDNRPPIDIRGSLEIVQARDRANGHLETVGEAQGRRASAKCSTQSGVGDEACRARRDRASIERRGDAHTGGDAALDARRLVVGNRYRERRPTAGDRLKEGRPAVRDDEGGRPHELDQFRLR